MKVDLKRYINKSQLSVINSCLKGEEGNHFKELLESLSKRIETMPVTYETDGQGTEAMVSLHYFYGGMDWYIIERDVEEEQHQAFGWVNLGDRMNAELGYISIEELLENGIELDLYWTPKSLKEIMGA